MKRRSAVPATDPRRSLLEPGPPEGLAAYHLRAGEAEFAVLEWSIEPAHLPDAALTPAERSVVELALAGLANAEIAGRRGCSARTVANELASAYRRLGVGSRAELGAWAVRRGGRAS